MYFRTVRGESRTPRLTSNSLAIRSSPHSGFSQAMRHIKCRRCAELAADPVLTCNATASAIRPGASGSRFAGAPQPARSASRTVSTAKPRLFEWRRGYAAVSFRVPGKARAGGATTDSQRLTSVSGERPGRPARRGPQGVESRGRRVQSPADHAMANRARMNAWIE
jgi:hypothetical protein